VEEIFRPLAGLALTCFLFMLHFDNDVSIYRMDLYCLSEKKFSEEKSGFNELLNNEFLLCRGRYFLDGFYGKWFFTASCYEKDE